MILFFLQIFLLQNIFTSLILYYIYLYLYIYIYIYLYIYIYFIIILYVLYYIYNILLILYIYFMSSSEPSLCPYNSFFMLFIHSAFLLYFLWPVFTSKLFYIFCNWLLVCSNSFFTDFDRLFFRFLSSSFLKIILLDTLPISFGPLFFLANIFWFIFQVVIRVCSFVLFVFFHCNISLHIFGSLVLCLLSQFLYLFHERYFQRRKKMVLDTSLLNIQHYKICIKGKVEQFRERSSALSYTSV